MKQVFFVNPPSPGNKPMIRDVYRSGRTSKEGMIWPQTQLAELAGAMRHVGQARIIDCVAEGMSYKRLREIILKERPVHIVFEVVPASYANDMKMVDLAQEVDATYKAVGPHIVSTETLNFNLDLKTMATPMYHLLPLHKYKMPFFGKNIFISVSRGCPFNCVFCRERVAWKGNHQTRPIDNIIKDIRILKKYRIDTYMMHAGVFTANKKWVMEFCKKVEYENIRWICNTHIKTIDKEMAQAMYDSGCWMIAPGIESGNDEVLKNIRKETNVTMIREKVHMMHDIGIKVWGYFIMGLPGDTVDTMEQTIDLACELPLDIAHFGIAAPYYKTDFFYMCKENGWLKADKWEDFDQNTKASVEYPDLSSKQIHKAVRRAYWKFYGRPRLIKRILGEALNTDIRILARMVK